MIEGSAFQFSNVMPTRVRFSGIDFGGPSADPYVIARDDERHLCLMRVPGRNGLRDALGHSTYHAAELILFGYNLHPERSGAYRVERIYRTIEPGRLWRMQRREMLRLMATIRHTQPKK